jgi:hypothetical protein
MPLEEVLKGWPISTDPAPNIGKARELFDRSVSIANIHAGQRDQKHVIDFYGEHSLPTFRQPT